VKEVTVLLNLTMDDPIVNLEIVDQEPRNHHRLETGVGFFAPQDTPLLKRSAREGEDKHVVHVCRAAALVAVLVLTFTGAAKSINISSSPPATALMLWIEIIVGVAAAISVASGIVTLTSAFVRGRFLRAYPRASRIGFGFALLVLGAVVGISTIKYSASTPPTNHSADPILTVSQMSANPVLSPPQPTSTPSTTAQINEVREDVKQPTAKSNVADDMGVRISIRDEANHIVPELVIAAQRVIGGRVSLDGNLRTATSTPDEQLQGIITTHLTLAVTVTEASHIIDAFELQSTGGGFTGDAAILQARQRLQAKLIKRLQEHQ
jgi:hypothetical protein